MSNYSKIQLNAIQWNGVADLTITSPDILFVDITGNPTTGTPRKLVLPETQNASREDNVEYLYTLTINDPNGFLTSSGLEIEPWAGSTGVVINDSAAAQTFTTNSKTILCKTDFI